MMRILLDAEPLPGQQHDRGDRPLVAPVYSALQLTPGQIGPALLDPDSVEQLVSHVQDLALVQGILPRGSAAGGQQYGSRRSAVAPVARIECWRALNFRPYQRWSDPAVPIRPPPQEQQCAGGGGGGSGDGNHPWLIRQPLTLSPVRPAHDQYWFYSSLVLLVYLGGIPDLWRCLWVAAGRL